MYWKDVRHLPRRWPGRASHREIAGAKTVVGGVPEVIPTMCETAVAAVHYLFCPQSLAGRFMNLTASTFAEVDGRLCQRRAFSAGTPCHWICH